MLVEFNTLPEHSKVWIYQSNRRFTEEELVVVSNKTKVFLEQWAMIIAFLCLSLCGFNIFS